MKKLSLKVKLIIGFGSLLVLLLTIGVLSYTSLGSLSSSAEAANSNLKKKELTIGMEEAIEKQSCGTLGFIITRSDTMLAHRQEGIKEYRDRAQELEKMLVTERSKKLFSEIDDAVAETAGIQEEEIALARKGNLDEIASLATGSRSAQLRSVLTKSLLELEEFEEKLKDDALAAQHTTESRTGVLIVVLSIIGVAVGLIVVTLVIRSITRGMSGMLDLAQKISSNDLSVADLPITSGDEIGKTCAALNTMKNTLHQMIQSIASTADHVASASEEISSSATQQAEGADRQKDQTAQVATAMQEMASTVLQVSENSNRAAEAARKASETAHHGGSIVNETLNRMREIAQSVSGTAKKMEELGRSSDQIGRIIGVIDDIADQTNLLALNAAIEAARAGEQGRGFAVVADEVRKLAERTTTATKEIAQMIKNIQDETKTAVGAMVQGTQQVEEGVKSTAQAGDALQQIIQMAEQVGEMITHIATASTQQSSATEQVNSNMDQIARLVKESAIGAQQSAKACQDLSGLALDLQKMVSNFKLARDGYQPSWSDAHRPQHFAKEHERPTQAKAFGAAAQ